MLLPFTHFISTSQLTKDSVGDIFERADFFEKVWSSGARSELLKEKIIALLFYEPSSRTMLSFQAATQGLSAGMILAQGEDASSLKKGETIEDTIRMAALYSDLIVMRHPQAGAAEKAASVSHVPFVNAGDGGNEHPTQALLDLYTIQKERGALDGLHIALVGDLKYGRTVHSLATLLTHYHVTITLVSPPALALPESYKTMLTNAGIKYAETDALESALDADVLYMTRIQKERFDDPADYDRMKDAYMLTAAHLTKNDITVMHPLPRLQEIAADVDAFPNAAYFRQARNGVPVRMALLSMLLGK